MEFTCINAWNAVVRIIVRPLAREGLVELSRQQGEIKLNMVSSYFVKERPP